MEGLVLTGNDKQAGINQQLLLALKLRQLNVRAFMYVESVLCRLLMLLLLLPLVNGLR